jgi:hypothetical protein
MAVHAVTQPIMSDSKLRKIELATGISRQAASVGHALADQGNPSMWERVRRKAVLGFTYDDLFGGGFRTDWMDAIVGAGVTIAIVLLFYCFVARFHGWPALKFLSAAGMALDIAGVARTVMAIQRAFQREHSGDVMAFGGGFTVVQVPDVPLLMAPDPNTPMGEVVTSGANATIKPVVHVKEAAARTEFAYAKSGMWLLLVGFALQIIAALLQ